jgi:hypothetical protein
MWRTIIPRRSETRRLYLIDKRTVEWRAPTKHREPRKRKRKSDGRSYARYRKVTPPNFHNKCTAIFGSVPSSAYYLSLVVRESPSQASSSYARYAECSRNSAGICRNCLEMCTGALIPESHRLGWNDSVEHHQLYTSTGIQIPRARFARPPPINILFILSLWRAVGAAAGAIFFGRTTRKCRVRRRFRFPKLPILRRLSFRGNSSYWGLERDKNHKATASFERLAFAVNAYLKGCALPGVRVTPILVTLARGRPDWLGRRTVRAKKKALGTRGRWRMGSTRGAIAWKNR